MLIDMLVPLLKGEKGRAKGQEDVALGLDVAVLLLHNLNGSLKDGPLAIDEPACVEGAAAVLCTPTTLKASPGPVTRRQLAAASQSQAATVFLYKEM